MGTAAAVAAAMLTGAAAPRAAAAAERAELVMGTLARIVIPGESATADRFDAAFAALRSVDAAMSLYRPASEVRRVNAHAAFHPEPVGPELFAVLTRARELAVATDGAFDPTVLPLLVAWGAYRELQLRTDEPVTVGFAGLRLDDRTRTVAFRARGMGLDLGGIAKGFALDRATAALRALGARRALLDLGGNLALVDDDQARRWPVAVRDPHSPDRPLGTLAVGRGGVSTSANYARDFAAEGWRAPTHIYDPRTRRPVGVERAVTVWAADATTADALSTALMVTGKGGADAVLARIPGAGALIAEGTRGDVTLTWHGEPPLAWDPAPDLVPARSARR
jgi:thiamine biosynthesis lipoprotein